MKHHGIVEKNLPLMIVLIVIAISWGGLAEIVPLFFLKETTQPIEWNWKVVTFTSVKVVTYVTPR